MPLPPKVTLREETYRVYKTGIPFYDAARLIGVAHLFLGIASAEIEDKQAYWEVKGIPLRRDEQQILWVIERLNPTDKERRLFQKKGRFLWEDFFGFFEKQSLEARKGRLEELKAEYDVAFQIGTRGLDPLAKYEILAPRSTGETLKKFKVQFQEVAAATLGRAFAAQAISRTKRQRDEMHILPIFRERFVLSGFLEYERNFSHASGGWVAAVWAALSILLELTAKRLPVVDFAYTREVKGPTGQPIFARSGYLGLEKLCVRWQQAVQEGNQTTLNLLRGLRRFLQDTSGAGTHEQVQSLARWVADFVANPNVEALVKIEQLKARLLAVSQSESIAGAYAAHQLLNRTEFIKEVRSMMLSDLPEVPWQVSQALARALGFDEKGWMNQFTRLENAPNFSQFIRQVEHIISRGYYREQQEQGKTPSIQQALTGARALADNLRAMTTILQDEKAFRAWKAIFLLDVLSRARFRAEETPETPEATTVENQAKKEG